MRYTLHLSSTVPNLFKTLALGAILCAFPVATFAQPTTPNGYDLLVKAGQAILPGENGSPSASEILQPDENLRRQKEAVQRNATALGLVRQALAIPITSPPFDVNNPMNGVQINAAIRELARQFIQESDVRLANGDAVGAFNSRLDALAMGVGIENGANSMTFLVGKAIETISLNKIDPIVSRLNAQEATAAATRLNAIEKQRPDYVEIVEAEKRDSLALLDQTLKTPDWQNDLAADAEQPDEKQALQQLTPETLRQEVGARWDVLVKHARKPYSLEATTLPPASNSAVALFSALADREKTERFLYESARTQNLLLSTSLLLKAQHDQNGAYPATLTTPNDPFAAGKPLVYKPFEKTYRLYSVGPDGKDDAGTAIMGRVKVDSVGDIMATVY